MFTSIESCGPKFGVKCSLRCGRDELCVEHGTIRGIRARWIDGDALEPFVSLVGAWVSIPAPEDWRRLADRCGVSIWSRAPYVSNEAVLSLVSLASQCCRNMRPKMRPASAHDIAPGLSVHYALEIVA